MWATTLWQSSSWHFDGRSALIGALIACVIAWVLYLQRNAVKQRLERLRAPLVSWRSRSQRSTGEKYLSALQAALRRLLLFTPEDPRQVFVPPRFLAPAALPTTQAEAAEAPATALLNYETLLRGHSRIIICGAPGSGRTTALALTLWRIAEPDATGGKPYQRFPLWIDLAAPGEAPDAKATPVQVLAEWATRFMPQAILKWLVRQLHTQPSLILIDNWNALPLAERREIARRIEQAATALPDSRWIIAAGTTGYGPLVEAGFTPVQIQPALDQEAPLTLHAGWSSTLGIAEPELSEEALAIMRWAVVAGDTLPELTLRINLQLRCQQTPYRPAEVLEILLRHFYLPVPGGAEEAPENAAQVQELAVTVLAQLARTLRLEERAVTQSQLQEMLDRIVPSNDKQNKTPGMVRKLIQNTALLDRSGKSLHFVHPVWEDFLTAKALAAETAETHLEPLLLLEHLYDLRWRYLLDCYTGISDAEPLIKALLRDGLAKTARSEASAVGMEAELAEEALVLAARWTIRSPEDIPWRNFVTKALAQALMQPAHSLEYRLKLAEALALVAGEEAYPIYQQVLRQPALPVRIAALRGIGWTGGARDLKLLAAALKDPHPEVQENTLRAISDLGIPEAQRFLLDLLPQSNERTMLFIAEILAEQPECWDGLREAAEADDLLIRRAAAHGLSAIRQPWARDLLQRMLRDDPQWLVRSAAEAALSEQTSLAVVEAPPQPDQTQWLMSWAAKQGLGLGVGGAALALLLHALQAGDNASRILAARTLSQIGRPEHLAALQALRDEPDPAVRQAIQHAQEQIEIRYRGIPEVSSPDEEPSKTSAS